MTSISSQTSSREISWGDLPPEMHLLVCEKMDGKTLAAFKQTCKYSKELVDVPSYKEICGRTLESYASMFKGRHSTLVFSWYVFILVQEEFLTYQGIVNKSPRLLELIDKRKSHPLTQQEITEFDKLFNEQLNFNKSFANLIRYSEKGNLLVRYSYLNALISNSGGMKVQKYSALSRRCIMKSKTKKRPASYYRERENSFFNRRTWKLPTQLELESLGYSLATIKFTRSSTLKNIQDMILSKVSQIRVVLENNPDMRLMQYSVFWPSAKLIQLRQESRDLSAIIHLFTTYSLSVYNFQPHMISEENFEKLLCSLSIDNNTGDEVIEFIKLIYTYRVNKAGITSEGIRGKISALITQGKIKPSTFKCELILEAIENISLLCIGLIFIASILLFFILGLIDELRGDKDNKLS